MGGGSATRGGSPATTKADGAARPEARRKLTWAEERELEGLMEQVDAAESRVAELHAALGEPEFYARPEPEQRAHFATLDEAKKDAERLAERWAELEERRG